MKNLKRHYQESEPGTFWLVEQYLDQLRYGVLQLTLYNLLN
jgi:hypothetical protein